MSLAVMYYLLLGFWHEYLSPKPSGLSKLLHLSEKSPAKNPARWIFCDRVIAKADSKILLSRLQKGLLKRHNDS